MFVPQANPRAAYYTHRQAIDEAIARVLASGSYILGEEARSFEHEYATWVGTRRAVTCASGTDAIALILRGLNVGAGSTVVTVSQTAVASYSAPLGHLTCDVHDGPGGASFSACPTTASLAGNSRGVGRSSVRPGLRPGANPVRM